MFKQALRWKLQVKNNNLGLDTARQNMEFKRIAKKPTDVLYNNLLLNSSTLNLR